MTVENKQIDKSAQTVLDALAYVPSKILYHAWTLFLFTKADIKGVIVPMTLFAVTSTPLTSLSRLPHVIFWLWLTVLQCDLPNQTLGRIEDEKNKSDRPIPSGRISFEAAVILRWLILPVCFVVSAFYSRETVYAAIAICALTYVYNEGGAAAANWFVRDFVIALMYIAWGSGACLIAGTDHTELTNSARVSLLYCLCVVTSTIHAEDFKDVVGDALVGRKTLPIVAPAFARYSFPPLIIAWSVFLSMSWKLPMAAMVAYIALGTLVGWRFVAYDSIKSDQRSFYLYSLWLTLGFTLPANVNLEPMLNRFVA